MRTVSDIGREIANEIMTRGHYQGGRVEDTEDADRGSCCIVTSDAYFFRLSLDEKNAISNRLMEILGVDDLQDVYNWNDTTPTATVLETLRNL